MLRQGKSSAAAVQLAPAGSWRGDSRQDKKATTWPMTLGGSVQALPVRARAHLCPLAGPRPTWRSRLRQTTHLRWGSKEKKEVREACGLPPVLPTAVRGTHEWGSPHQRLSEYRCTPRQSLSCPDRCRSDNEKAPTTSPPGLFANVQLKLPAVRAVAGYAPDLEGAEFGNASLQPHRYNCSLLAIQFERDLQRAEFLDIGTPIFQQAADMVLLTDAGTQEIGRAHV